MEIERELRKADPLGFRLDSLPSAAAEALVQELVMNSITTHATGPSRTPADVRARRARQRKRRIAAGLMAAGVLAVPGVAAAALGGMHSGFFGTGGEEVAGEEKLYTNSPDIRTVVQSLADEFPLPANTTYAPVLARYPTQDAVLDQRTGLGQVVQTYALCSWYRDWQTGSASERATAQTQINAAPNWKYWNFAKDDKTGQNPGKDVLSQIATETQAGDSTTLSQYISANCATDLVTR